MVLIRRGQGRDTELLLARSPHFPPGMYSALAGFVEPSETLEAAARREVQEEVGVQIRDLRYQFSQPWPFPHSLMLGFTAEYAGATSPRNPARSTTPAGSPSPTCPRCPPRSASRGH